MFGSSSRSQRSSASSISPFRSRKPAAAAAAPPPPASAKRPVTPSSGRSSSSSRPASKPASVSPAAASVTPKQNAGPTSQSVERPGFSKSKENVTVTVRFRPLSPREINKGDEVAWYADGEYSVRNEYNPSIAYGFDRVFGPATTTRHVYDVAAQHVVSGAMQGMTGTVFAYGVTSSGKTHTMHGEQKSPGIIPLAVKDVFGIIQETPGREFLLRVSYLEIYNEVINDLLDPTGQNLRIREDAQGTYVEGIKEEVVLSPAHALSLIASGEEHRHVGSNNFNLLSSRSHTIFTLTIESSPRVGDQVEEDITLSQLNLIDLAGSESSKTETTGLRRKEGSYINKSLLTLGTVISKLTDGKPSHIPYRDSKLTRLLQSSLSGHGRISLICTVTPASSNSEETHNTLKFAHRSKHVEVKASQNKIVDEKSLIKKYQREITTLKEELQQLKGGIMGNPYASASAEEDFVNLKLQLEAGQVKLQSRLEEEEQAKAALIGRIQRLTKLILVSTKNAMSTNLPERPGHRRRHSFGEDELAYLPDRKREYMINDDAGSYASEFPLDGKEDVMNLDELVNDYKRNKKRGMLGWFKVRKPESLPGLPPSADREISDSGSPASGSKSSQSRVMFSDIKDGRRKSLSRKGDDASAVESFPERTQAGELFRAAVGGRHLPPSGTTITDQMDLLQEQVKMLAGEVALSTSSLKRLSEQVINNPDDLQLTEHMQKLKDEIHEKKLQMSILQKRMIGSLETAPHTSNMIEMSQALSKLTTQLNEKTFELEIKTADNRILQEQLQTKMSENVEMQETILMLRQQLNLVLNRSSASAKHSAESEPASCKTGSGDLLGVNWIGSYDENCLDENTPTSVINLNRVFSQDSRDCGNDAFLNSQDALIENLRQDKLRLIEQKDGLEIQIQKLAEEASYAKELASAAAVELRNLADEVTKLSFDNAKLMGDLAAAKEASCRRNCCTLSDDYRGKPDGALIMDMQRELDAIRKKEADLEITVSEKYKLLFELRRKLDEAKQREQNLENEVANLWVLVAKVRKSGDDADDKMSQGVLPVSDKQGRARNGILRFDDHYSREMPESNEISDEINEPNALERLRASYLKESERCRELESTISRLKGDDISGLEVAVLEELQNLHVEAITKICHAKCASRIFAN
ncbi:kinesin-like protein KIN-7C, mitochondrial isoform X2 [Rhodamnia argentea]|uniref:Kinesin-like protein KIN-7C, mitochondrial isoform X2 n=1 Tax=Rhodamnia argentea TaxID=178133 RepID=A0ABM3H228_9MYRT|nr:kinesin-like protein KIN-7C, mitochondrial isoform X2 [Rhodamnia argentea]